MTNKTEKTYMVELTEKELRELFLSVHYVGEKNGMKEMKATFHNKETISLLNKLLNAYNA